MDLQRYNKFYVALVAAAVIFLNNENIDGITDISDNLAVALGALGIFVVPNRPPA